MTTASLWAREKPRDKHDHDAARGVAARPLLHVPGGPLAVKVWREALALFALSLYATVGFVWLVPKVCALVPFRFAWGPFPA